MIHSQFNLNISAKDVYNDKGSRVRDHVNPGIFSFGSFTENLPANRVGNATTSGSVKILSDQSDYPPTFSAGQRFEIR